MDSGSTAEGDFRTGQVKLAIWQAIVPAGRPANDPSPQFLSRFNKMLLLEVGTQDRPGRGTDSRWTAYETCEMAFAHELLDRAYNPEDIGFIIKHARPILREAFNHVLRNCLPVGGFYLRQHRPSLPARLWLPELPEAAEPLPFGLGDKRRRSQQSDPTVWITFRAHEQREAYGSRESSDPIYMRPELHIGLRKLVEHFDVISHQHTNRGEDLFEVGYFFGHVIENVRAAPVPKRGRPK